LAARPNTTSTPSMTTWNQFSQPAAGPRFLVARRKVQSHRIEKQPLGESRNSEPAAKNATRLAPPDGCSLHYTGGPDAIGGVSPSHNQSRKREAATDLARMSGRKWLLSFLPPADFTGASFPHPLQTPQGRGSAKPRPSAASPQTAFRSLTNFPECLRVSAKWRECYTYVVL
jgi:hypothetical protein